MAGAIGQMKTYQLISIVEMSHCLMEHIISPSSVVADMTLGNGYDSAFLAPKVAHVYAFDISEQAIAAASRQLTAFPNVSIFHASHEAYAQYIPDVSAIDLFVFNLGYLPGSSKDFTTTKETTLATLQSLFTTMKPEASILLVCYVGHPGGHAEYQGILDYCHMISHQAEIVRYEFLSAPESAKIVMISNLRRDKNR